MARSPGTELETTSGYPLSSASFVRPGRNAFRLLYSSEPLHGVTTSRSNQILYIILSSESFTTAPDPEASHQILRMVPLQTSGKLSGTRQAEHRGQRAERNTAPSAQFPKLC